MEQLRFRQVHLDFHTNPDIENIGGNFDADEWIDTLKEARVDSITIFAKCHHGLSYYPTKTGVVHPHLKIDLLKAQYEACKAADINAPIYISAGTDTWISDRHPEWREARPSPDGRTYTQWGLAPGFLKLCFNSPYLDYLTAQIEEVARLYPECDGIFLDIINQGECMCPSCIKWMKDNGLDPSLPESRKKCAARGLEEYYRRSTEAARCVNPRMRVFHNSGHVAKNNTDILKYFSHLELESLPTGGWGYDHFPMSASFVSGLGMDFLGMTGKFHTTWGEFGGFKHPNALRYECMQMLAFGSKCSVGDQLSPDGRLDKSTYSLIGSAYKEVEAKEKWCAGARRVADIAVLSREAETGRREADNGTGRVLLEGHYLFDVINRSMPFEPYRLLILADDILADEDLGKKLQAYLRGGGRIILSGTSGLDPQKKGFVIDTGCRYIGESPYQPDYLKAGGFLSPEHVSSPVVMYLKSSQAELTDGAALGEVYYPEFNRTWEHFCSHQHAPAGKKSPFPGAVLNKAENVLYYAHPIFEIYGDLGAVIYKELAQKGIDYMLKKPTLKTNLPSSARCTLTRQKNSYVLHLLYANIMSRGDERVLSPEGYVRPSRKTEVIEELLPLYDTEITLDIPEKATEVLSVPDGKPIPFCRREGKICFTIDKFTCHAMIEIKTEG
ncbi:MAG: alpha-L-fucosidase [Abditibacteriota bacterium]|nr:alpha-L-fucosidase [Abditibacteriota bacterium]